ncbi:MAG: hypothetical protein LBS29_04720 [Endomicrobium sp.]|jgi:hypothetical protein|nr:hypothetical protein [Endomicrobium sp.]
MDNLLKQSLDDVKDIALEQLKSTWQYGMRVLSVESQNITRSVLTISLANYKDKIELATTKQLVNTLLQEFIEYFDNVMCGSEKEAEEILMNLESSKEREGDIASDSYNYFERFVFATFIDGKVYSGIKKSMVYFKSFNEALLYCNVLDFKDIIYTYPKSVEDMWQIEVDNVSHSVQASKWVKQLLHSCLILW